MCEFSYHHYDACAHRFIEIMAHCAKALWNAGMNGELIPCNELMYTSHLVKKESLSKDNGIWTSFWKGRSGFCRKCEIDFVMPKTGHYSTHNDVPMTAIQKQSTPEGLAQLGFPKPALDHPFIYTPYVIRNPYQLLGVADQFDASFITLLGDLYFPLNLAIYDPDSSSNQWASFAHFDNVRCEGCPNPYFTANGGFTTQDRADVHHGVKLGWQYHEIWARSFKERGMDWDAFKLYAPRAEVIVLGDPIHEAKIWNNIVKGDWMSFNSSIPSEPVEGMDNELGG